MDASFSLSNAQICLALEKGIIASLECVKHDIVVEWKYHCMYMNLVFWSANKLKLKYLYGWHFMSIISAQNSSGTNRNNDVKSQHCNYQCYNMLKSLRLGEIELLGLLGLLIKKEEEREYIQLFQFIFMTFCSKSNRFMVSVREKCHLIKEYGCSKHVF